MSPSDLMGIVATVTVAGAARRAGAACPHVALEARRGADGDAPRCRRASLLGFPEA